MDRDAIRTLCETGELEWTLHAMERLKEREIPQEDVEEVFRYGEIIEEYPDDTPYPSCLMMGGKKNLHVVCGIGKDRLWVITVYYPNIIKWSSNFKTRKA
jgi:hypothetical protein